jgi:PadR family transcriptional regulator PadR
MKFGRDLMRGSLDLMVLSVLAEGPQYGYLIQKRLGTVSDDLVQLKAGTLYPLLHRLEQAGAITARWDNTTGRDRKWYALTDKGRRRLQTQAHEWHQYADCIRQLIEPALAGLNGSEEPPPAPA